MNIKSAIKAIPVVGPLARRVGRLLSPRGPIGYRIDILRKVGGVHPRICSLCNYHGRFSAFGNPPRWDARCPKCGSLERHRLLALFLKHQPNVMAGRVIHFAPEPSVANLIEPLADQYQSADLFRPDCDLRLDLEQLELLPESVDVFVASHVLEHVDDSKALSEFYRCLTPAGIAIIMVPIVEAWQASYENQSITTPEDRTLHFGQWDHVRYFGSDLRDRIRASGFEVDEFTASPEECVRHGLMRGETVFIARKPS